MEAAPELIRRIRGVLKTNYSHDLSAELKVKLPISATGQAIHFGEFILSPSFWEGYHLRVRATCSIE